MKYSVVAIRDLVGDVYSVPNFSASLGMAQRSFADEVNRADEKNILYMHADDFALFEVGVYDDATGLAKWLELPRQLCLGRDVKVRS